MGGIDPLWSGGVRRAERLVGHHCSGTGGPRRVPGLSRVWNPIDLLPKGASAMSDIERWERLVKSAAKSTAEVYQRQAPDFRRVRGVVAEVCDVCAFPVESDQHKNHCKG